MEIDATKGKQELYCKPEESLLAHSGNISKEQLLKIMEERKKQHDKYQEELKRRKKADRFFHKRGHDLL